MKEYTSTIKPTWCLGCSNFGVRTALLKAFVDLGLNPEEIAMVCDIGCLGNSCNWYKVYGFHGLHGRTVPVMIGAKLANKKMTVIGLVGDGGAYGEGLNHLVEACRSNADITLIVSNNHLYSLTTGQASPTTKEGIKTKSTPQGTIKQSLNPLAIALDSGAGFVARGYADDVKHLTELIKQGINHRGFSLIDVLQPCLTINRVNTREWYKERIYQLDKKWPNKDKKAAKIKTEEWGKKIPIGIFYQKQKPTYQEGIGLKQCLIDCKKADIKQFLKEFE